MGYVIKHSTSNVNNSRRKGNVAIGVDSEGYDKTSVSGFYAGVTPVEGKHNLVRTSASDDPDFYALTDTELINFANQLGGSVSTTLEAQNYLLQQDNIVFLDELPEDIETDSLVLELDASVESSFLDNQPTTNKADTESKRTFFGHNSGNYGNVVELDSAPEKGPGWKKIIIKNRGSNFRIAQLPYINHATNADQVYSLEYDFGDTTGYYLRLDGSSGGIGDKTDDGNKISISFNSDRSRDMAMFLNHNIPGVSGINDVIYYRNYQVEDRLTPTSFTTGSRSQNTTWYDLSGNGGNAFLANNVTYNTEGWFEFDGTSSYAEIDSTVSLGNPCTVTALVNVDSVGSYTIYGPHANGHDNWLGTNGTQLEMFGTQTADTNNFTVRGNSLVCDGTRWYHVACTIDGATARVWINGEEKNSTTRAYEIGGWSSKAGIGRRGAISQRYFPGKIAKIRGYSKALSSDEMKQNFYEGDIVTTGLNWGLDAGNLVSYESGSSISYSLTGSVYSGSLANGVAYSKYDGGVWDFDGSDDYISTPTYTFGNGNWTLNMWVNVNNFSKAYFMSNISGGPVANVFDAYGGQIVYRNYDGAWQNHSGNTTLSTGEWYMLTWVNYAGATDQDGTMQMYVNGISDSGVFNSYTTNGGPCNIIAGYYGSTRFDGKIGNVLVYTKALSDSEVLQNYNAQKNRFL